MQGNQFEIEIPAVVEKLPEVKTLIERGLRGTGCSNGTLKQIHVAAEEVFVNIAHYAYAPGTGTAVIRMELTESPLTAVITFTDRGIPYNPLENEDPEITLSVNQRKIGGLGIFLTKATMDSVEYARRDGQNILTIRKEIC